MTSAVFPPDAPPRVWRFVEPAAMPHPDMVAVLDRARNVQIINRALFEMLDRDEQNRLLRSPHAVVEVTALAA